MNTIRSYFFFVLGATLLLGSCSSEDDIIDTPKGKVEKTFNVQSSKRESRLGISNFNPTGTAIEINWDNTDEISVFAEGELSENAKFTFNHIVDYSNNGAFNGTVTDLKGTKKTYSILYPYQANAHIDEENCLHFTIPTQQTATNGTFDPQAGIQIGSAAASSTSVALLHVCSYIHLTVVGDGCNKIEVEATQPGWYLAGGVKAKPSSGSASITGFDSGASKITLTNTNQLAGTFIIAFVPTKGKTTNDNGNEILSSPIKITVKNAQKRMQISRTLEAGQSYVAGEFRDLGIVSFAGESPVWTN